jgi:hypothetical protein
MVEHRASHKVNVHSQLVEHRVLCALDKIREIWHLDSPRNTSRQCAYGRCCRQLARHAIQARQKNLEFWTLRIAPKTRLENMRGEGVADCWPKNVTYGAQALRSRTACVKTCTIQLRGSTTHTQTTVAVQAQPTTHAPHDAIDALPASGAMQVGRS